MLDNLEKDDEYAGYTSSKKWMQGPEALQLEF